MLKLNSNLLLFIEDFDMRNVRVVTGAWDLKKGDKRTSKF